jgi:hypothetical protein
LFAPVVAARERHQAMAIEGEVVAMETRISVEIATAG